MNEGVSSEARSEGRRFLIPGRVLVCGIILAFLGLLGWGLMKAQAGPRESGPAPDFALVTFEGQEVTLSDLRGQVVAINFWAS